MDKPAIIDFPKIGKLDIGFISIATSGQGIPFAIKRAFWTYYTPESIIRGRHAHHKTQQVLIAVAGRIVVNTELPDGEIQTFVLETPYKGLYVPPHVWHTMQYSHNAVQLSLASTEYDESDYIREYDAFKKLKRQAPER